MKEILKRLAEMALENPGRTGALIGAMATASLKFVKETKERQISWKDISNK